MHIKLITLRHSYKKWYLFIYYVEGMRSSRSQYFWFLFSIWGNSKILRSIILLHLPVILNWDMQRDPRTNYHRKGNVLWYEKVKGLIGEASMNTDSGMLGSASVQPSTGGPNIMSPALAATVIINYCRSHAFV